MEIVDLTYKLVDLKFESIKNTQSDVIFVSRNKSIIVTKG